ncbi:MAG TPA: hypothetical protein VJ729_16445 [Nitrososphaeraceae archaeon]|nr:hypothetical protein [Nitrososphaeraceae archaeon]
MFNYINGVIKSDTSRPIPIMLGRFAFIIFNNILLPVPRSKTSKTASPSAQ